MVLEEDASCGIRREVLATFEFRFLDGLVPFVASHRDINDELAVEVMLQVLAPGHNFRSVPFADRIDLFLFVGREEIVERGYLVLGVSFAIAMGAVENLLFRAEEASAVACDTVFDPAVALSRDFPFPAEFEVFVFLGGVKIAAAFFAK